LLKKLVPLLSVRYVVTCHKLPFHMV